MFSESMLSAALRAAGVTLLGAATISSHAGGTTPTNVGLEWAAEVLRGDVRVAVVGDSYAVPFTARTPVAALLVWPIDLVAVEAGARTTQYMMRTQALASPVANIESGDPLGYTVERHHAERYYAVPVFSIREFYTDGLTLGPDDGVVRFSLPDISWAGDVRFRLLHLMASDESLQTPTVTLDGAPVSLEGPPAQMAVAGDIAVAADRVVHVAMPDLHPGRYFHPAGGIYYRTADGSRVPGYYHSFIADASWSYSGVCSDTDPTSTHDKRFSREQMRHWLEATTIDTATPVVFLWSFAAEPLDEETSLDMFRRIVDELDAAATEASLSPRHVIMVSHMFSMGQIGIGPEVHAFIQGQGAAAMQVASERDNVAALSLYGATDGVLFDGGPESVAWLKANGYEQFAGLGSLMDTSLVHPNEDGAEFFALVAGDLIREAGCPSDLTGDGVVSIEDLLLLLQSWTGIEDMLAMLNNWGACWPVDVAIE